MKHVVTKGYDEQRKTQVSTPRYLTIYAKHREITNLRAHRTKGYDECSQQNHFLQFYHATRTFTLFASFPKYNFVANISKLIHVLDYFRNDF